MIVKCQDEVCSNRQRFTHVEIMREYEGLGFVAEDIFVVMRNNRPGVSRMARQVHAPKEPLLLSGLLETRADRSRLGAA